MYTNFRIESTQVRGRRIEEAMKSLAWDEIPQDGLILKEYEAPTLQEDLVPEYKPSIKNTLREFWELREENYEEENKSQKMREEKSKERSQSISMQMDDRYEYDDTIKSTPNQKLSRKNSKLIKVSGEKERYRKSSEHSESGKKSNHSHSGHKGERRPPRVIQKAQPTEYMVKLAKALEESKVMKGKLKISQKLSFPTSSTLSALMGKKTKVSSLTQFNKDSLDIGEDIEDWDTVDHQNIYMANKGQKKIKLDFKVKVEPEIKDLSTMRTESSLSKQGKEFNTQNVHEMDSKTPEKSLKKILNKVDFQTDIKPPPIPSDNRSQR